MRTFFISTLLACLASSAGAQAALPSGKWQGATRNMVGGELGVEVEIKDAAGSWRFLRHGTQGRNNPCLAQVFPIAVKSEGPDVVRIDVAGAAVVQGCNDLSMALKYVDERTLEGKLDDGRPIKLTRP